MVRIKPFAALRPRPDVADQVASVPYDVVNTREARDLVQGNDLSFLHVVRPEVDLPEDTPSGLVQSLAILGRVPGIEVIRFGAEDIQRHPLVQRIADAYEKAEKRRAADRPEGEEERP